MEEVINILKDIAINMNRVLDITLKHEKESIEAHSGVTEKLNETIGTTVSMLHLTERNIDQIAEIVSSMKGIQNLTSTTNSDNFYSPIQEMIFDRIFEVIGMETDLSVNHMKSDFLLYSFKELGLMRLTENEQDRSIKEEYFTASFNYLKEKYNLSLASSMLIMGYFDIYLIFTTNKNHVRVNGLFSIIRQLYFNINNSSPKFNDTIPKI